jgi:hypothetical protein
MKLPNWRSLASPSALQFIDKYSTLPEGTIAQLTAQASSMDLRHLVAILLVVMVTRINLLDVETIFKLFSIPHAHNEYATKALADILAAQ